MTSNETLTGEKEMTTAIKVGDLIKFKIPGLNGPMSVAGIVKRILPDSRLEVKSQNHGYHVVDA